MFARDIKLLHSIKCQISNSIVRENFNICILEHDLKYSLEHVKPEPLSIKRQSLVQCLHELLLVKGSQLIVNGFISEEIDDMITFICSK